MSYTETKLDPSRWSDSGSQVKWLVKLASSLLDLQGELIEALLVNCRFGPACPYCKEIVARAKKIKEGIE